MFFKINENIFLVSGALNSCIYDLPHNQLHIINKDTYNLLLRVTHGEDIVEAAEQDFLSNLVSGEILCRSTQPDTSYKSIDDVFSYARPMDFAWIELTNICNLKCIHCYNEQDNIKKQTLSFEDLKRSIDELESIGVRQVQLIGGEPFVIKKEILFEMIDYVATHMKSFEIFINGTLTSNVDLQYLKDKYSNLHIATSLHSYIQQEHEKVTQIAGSYEKTLRCIKTMCKLNIPHRFVGALIGGVNIGQDCGIGGPSRRDYIRLSGRANLSLYNDELLKRKIITQEKVHSGNIEEILKYNYEKSCYATHLYIGSDMNVYPCPMERRIHHGNLREEHLLSILKPEIINISKNDVNMCRDCEYRYLCMDCRPDSLGGEFHEHPWYCTYNPYRGEWLSFDEFKKKIGISSN